MSGFKGFLEDVDVDMYKEREALLEPLLTILSLL
jgi:hypothetical protein